MARVYSTALFVGASGSGSDWTETPDAGFLWVIRDVIVNLSTEDLPLFAQLYVGEAVVGQWTMAGDSNATFREQHRIVVPAGLEVRSYTQTMSTTGSVTWSINGYLLTTP